jgi:16S rRNA G966 N2-methylase RsmD
MNTVASVRQELFGALDFAKIPEDRDFKEASVRADIIDPLLKKLGFTSETILREKALQSPFLRTGSTTRPVNLIPDYVLKVAESCAWVLDAKAPNQKVINDENVEQVYIYAMHPEIRSNYFALCNGVEFACYRTNDTGTPVLYFKMEDIDQYWPALKALLSANSFQTGKAIVYQPVPSTQKEQFDYDKRPLLKEIHVKKQQAKRHFGVHGYFTRQTWNVVSAYIKNFSQPGDLVLDPFGGSGVTAIEALVNNRRAINVDLNPMAVFIVRSLLTPVDLTKLMEAFNSVKDNYEKQKPKSKSDIKTILAKLPLPANVPLPKTSDVKMLHDLYTEEQMAELVLLKSLIKKISNAPIRETLMLVFSGIIGRANKTWYSLGGFQGGESVFRYFRYRIAPKPASLDIGKYFKVRFFRVYEAKKELSEKAMLNHQTCEGMFSNIQIIKGSATDLAGIEKETVDYIYTDPPYGAKIPYLDLSTMWNAWLDLDVTEDDYKMEAIEGGEHNKTKSDYNMLISKSIQEMYRVLKFDRWLSFVFAHKDPEFWHLIIDTCEKCGFEYIGAVSQKNGQTSYKKRQHPSTVLSGQLIINFRKVKNPRAVLKANLGMDTGEIVMQVMEGIIAKNDGATLEQINNELIIKGMELGFLDLLSKEYSDITPILHENFDYDKTTELYTIKKDTRFKTQIDVRLRIKFYLISYLRRMERENIVPSFNDIIFNIMPLLKNGVTPEHQTILSVLEDIAERVGDDGWRLRSSDKGLFDGVG